MNISKHLNTWMKRKGNSSSEILLKKEESYKPLKFKHQHTDNVKTVPMQEYLPQGETPMSTRTPSFCQSGGSEKNSLGLRQCQGQELMPEINKTKINASRSTF